ncbi:MAG: Fe-S cluster assembly ATPase SufC [Patescibacteria group bacterium]
MTPHNKNKKLSIEHISIAADAKTLVSDVSLTVPFGKVVALMGPNGSGKSTLVNAIMGNPQFSILAGRVLMDKEDITVLPPHEKARKGLFLSFQNPPDIAGVSIFSFLRGAYNAVHTENVSVFAFRELLEREAENLSMEKAFLGRTLADGFSGGEKKQLEMLQLAILRPRYALLDETDAGLDVDALHRIAETIQRFSKEMGILLITHHARVLEYIIPDEVRIMQSGKITRSGGKELAEEIEEKGYK